MKEAHIFDGLEVVVEDVPLELRDENQRVGHEGQVDGLVDRLQPPIQDLNDDIHFDFVVERERTAVTALQLNEGRNREGKLVLF